MPDSTPSQRRDADRPWTRRAYLAIAVLLGIRVGYLALGWTDLVPDEAYYWHWSRQLDWCYYSKPPMVAWIIGASTRLFDSTTFFVRLPAALLSTSVLLALFLLARRMYDAETGFWAVLVMALSTGATALSLIMTIDPPLLASWSFSMLLVWWALEAPERNGRWAGAGFVVCLGLLSKPSMLAFPGLLLAYLAIRERRVLARPGPWLCIVVSFLAFVPILWWNSQNDWITFGHAADHFTPGEDKPLINFKTFGDFVGGQAGILSPITFVLLLVVLVRSLLNVRRLEREATFLVVFSAIPVVVIVLLSLKQRVHGNWSAPFYLGGTILLAAWARGHVPGPAKLRAWFRPGLYVGAAFVLLTYSLPVWVQSLSFGGTRKDPTFRVRGWVEYGEEVGARLAELPEQTFVVGSRREYVSEAAFYAPGHPTSFRIPRERIESQYELWGGPRGYEGWDALIVTDDDELPSKELRKAFEEVVAQEQIYIPLGAGGGRTVNVHHARNLKAWPHPDRERQP